MRWPFKSTLFNLDAFLNRMGKYMEKFYILPVAGIHPNTGLHRFLSSDDRSMGLHDHPYDFFAMTLRGKGREVFRADGGGTYEIPLRLFRFYSARKLHAIKLDSDCLWTLVIHGPRRRVWGFDDGEHWIPYHWALNQSLEDFWKKSVLAKIILFGLKKVSDEEVVMRQMQKEGKKLPQRFCRTDV